MDMGKRIGYQRTSGEGTETGGKEEKPFEKQQS